MSSGRKRKAETALHETRSSPIQSRKIKSCDTCRKMKRRCENQGSRNACRRCRVLKTDCSFEALSDLEVDAELTQLAPSTDHERIRALENAVSELQDLLKQKSPPAKVGYGNGERRDISPESQRALPPLSKEPSVPHVSERNTRAAPMRLIYDMNQHILGTPATSREIDVAGDAIALGIVNHEMASELLKGFGRLSRRWLFMNPDVMSLRKKSPLLFAACILSGLQIKPYLFASELHNQLYQHVMRLMHKSIFMSPLPIEVIQSMLILSMWNLLPDKSIQHTDSWVLSGVAAMHGISSFSFDQVVRSQKSEVVKPGVWETIRSWNLICLCHLQFSIGTGRPPIISSQYLEMCDEILNLPSYDSRDQLVAAGVKLYATLWRLLSSSNVEMDSPTWKDIDDCKAECGFIYGLNTSKPLRFAYSCCYLILARRTLKYMYEESLKGPAERSNANNETLFIKFAIENALSILTLFSEMSELTDSVRPAYENLLTSFAMVTLSEFAMHLDDLEITIELMEEVSYRIQLGGKAEPVSKWSLDVLRKYAVDIKQPKAVNPDPTTPLRGMRQPSELSERASINFDYAPELSFEGINQDFPTLEDMFLRI